MMNQMAGSVASPVANPIISPVASVFYPEQNLPQIIPNIPNKCYFENSEFYQIRGGFIAEVIQNPAVKFLEKGMMGEVIRDLTRVTLASFGKTEDQTEIYASKKVIKKNGIFVDWLTIVRHEERIVAYAAASYLDIPKSLLYLSATIVDEEYQAKNGIGLFIQIYVWEKILRNRGDFDSQTLNIVTRSRNKDVARIMGCVLKNMKISGEDNLVPEDKNNFNMVAKLIGSPFDERTGINKEVYPAGLPNGIDKQDEIDGIFAKLDACDAYLISGRGNYERISKLLKREVKMVEKNMFEYEPIKEKLAA